MKHLLTVVLTTLVLSVVPGEVQAQAQPAFTARTVNVRAGPGRDYPLVAVLPAGLQIWVQGCLSDYSWCDVVAGPNRGWAYAGNLSYFYQNTYVPVLDYGPVIGIGVLGFVLDDYWPRHYRERRWYPERHRWADRPPPPRFRPSAPPRPGFQRPRPQPAVPLQPGYQRPVPVQPRSQPAVPLQPRPGTAAPGSVTPAVPRQHVPGVAPSEAQRRPPGTRRGRPDGPPGEGAGRGPRGEGPPGQQVR
jgi:uncharacterized protein YraI